MRLADELLDDPSDRALPAPTGLPAPAGQQPAVVDHLPHNPTVPAGPRLPPRETRTTKEPTGQVPTTAAAAAMAALFTQSVPVTESTGTLKAVKLKKRRRVKATVLTVLLVGAAGAAVTLRNTAFADRITGHGYDHNPLPATAVEPPTFMGAEYTVTYQYVGLDNGLSSNFWDIERDTVNYQTGAATMTIDHAKAAILGGNIGTAKSTAPTQELIVDRTAFYRPGPTPADAWTRIPHVASVPPSILSPRRIPMYQDVIDPTLRSQTPTTVVHEVRNGADVTTYFYKIPLGELYASAPTVFEMMRDLDGTAADDAPVTIAISLDEHWMVRYLDIALDYQAVLDHTTDADPDATYFYRYTIDVLSITDTPEPFALPSNVVDETTTTTAPPTTLPPETLPPPVVAP
ncbi:MAG TPA: hypothetical protein VH761_06055 [Ilumatobacteraceae bacterium]